MKAKKKVRLSEKDVAAINRQLGFHQAGVEYDVTIHNRDVYQEAASRSGIPLGEGCPVVYHKKESI